MTKAIPRRHMRDELKALIALLRDGRNIEALVLDFIQSIFSFLKKL